MIIGARRYALNADERPKRLHTPDAVLTRLLRIHDEFFITPHAEHVHHLCSINAPHLPQFHPSRSVCAGFGIVQRGVFVSLLTPAASRDRACRTFDPTLGCCGRSTPQASQARNRIGLMQVQI